MGRQKIKSMNSFDCRQREGQGERLLCGDARLMIDFLSSTKAGRAQALRNGVGAAVLFATLQGAPALVASDFQVI
jgi:hypothetical protein